MVSELCMSTIARTLPGLSSRSHSEASLLAKTRGATSRNTPDAARSRSRRQRASAFAPVRAASSPAARLPCPSAVATSSRAATNNARDCQNAAPIWTTRNGGGVSFPDRPWSHEARRMATAKSRAGTALRCSDMGWIPFR